MQNVEIFRKIQKIKNKTRGQNKKVCIIFREVKAPLSFSDGIPNWKRGEVVLLLLWAATPQAALLGRAAWGALRSTTGPSGLGAPSSPYSNAPS